jgi:hypothetical protein
MDALTTTRPTLAALRFRLADLQQDRYAIEMSNSRAYTSGALDRIIDEMIDLRAEIARREAEQLVA